MAENYESKDIKKNIEENFIFLMVDFYEVQVEFLSMLIKLFKDLDKAYILLSIIKKIPEVSLIYLMIYYYEFSFLIFSRYSQ